MYKPTVSPCNYHNECDICPSDLHPFFILVEMKLGPNVYASIYSLFI
jgi:hypothetical protein